MGYTTSFEGQFLLDRRLTEAHRAYLQQFGETRRMKRDVAKLAAAPDPVREAVGLPLGPEGAYFVGGEGFKGQDDHPSILDHSEAPEGQPGLWCHWIPDDRGTHIVYSGVEKFYNYIDWLEYLITHFLAPWGYILNGEVYWEGEEEEDEGLIRVQDNQVEVFMLESEEDPALEVIQGEMDD